MWHRVFESTGLRRLEVIYVDMPAYQLVTKEIISSKKDAAKPASRPRSAAPPHPNAHRQWERCSRPDRRDELSHGPLVTPAVREPCIVSRETFPGSSWSGSDISSDDGRSGA